MNGLSEITLRITSDRNIAEEWELVLISEGLSPSVHPKGEGFALRVPATKREKAEAVLSSYESENLRQPAEKDQSAGVGHKLTALSVAAALLLFFFITTIRHPEIPWIQRGSADAERIFLGELWRAVTALTLHSDFGHALSNSIAIALFLGAIAAPLGSGLACALVLLAGAGGNLLTALLHGPIHVSIGSSTSVFATVGLLGALGVTRRQQRGDRGHRAWVPIAASLALLAMLGTSGQRTDLWAHLLGLLVGAFLGFPASIFLPKAVPAGVQWTLGAAALVAVIGSWLIALS